jgi:hypothetical protein
LFILIGAVYFVYIYINRGAIFEFVTLSFDFYDINQKFHMILYIYINRGAIFEFVTLSFDFYDINQKFHMIFLIKEIQRFITY